ncbi:MAG: hypothetical protein U0324_18115 [Polyangiales bacterium]
MEPRVTRLARTLFIAALAGCGADPPAAPPDASPVDRPDAAPAPDRAAPDAPSLDAPAPDASAPDAPSLDLAPPPADLPAPPPDAPVDVAAPVDVDARNIPAAAALYTADRTRFGIRDVAGALARALAAPGADNVILYVHGRGCGGGGEPNKSLTEAMPALARDYTAAPILLFWPGSDDACPLGFPESRAREAGPALAAVLGDLHRELATRPRPGVRFTLLTHSMGSLVLEAATAVPGVGGLPPTLFATAVVNAGASAAPDHAAWLARVTFAGAVFSTVNDRDLVLTAAGLGRATRLGKSLAGARLAAGRAYVDFTANGVNHAYYIPSGQSGAAMTAFYQRVMNGLPYDFAASSGVAGSDVRDGAVVHRFNGR